MAVYDYGTIMKNAISKNEKQQQQLQDEYLKQAAAAAKKSQEASASIKGWADNHNSQYNKFIDYNYTHHYTDTPGYEKIMQSYGVAGNAAAKKASDSVRAGNGGNVDSYASANANRQRLAFTDAAHEKALSADNAAMDRIERLLSSYGVDMRAWGDSLQKGVGQDDARSAQTLAGATAMAETGAGLVKTGDTNATARYGSDNTLEGTKYSSNASLAAARAQAEASRYAAEQSAKASMYSADRSLDAANASAYQYFIGDGSNDVQISANEFNSIKKQLDEYYGDTEKINDHINALTGEGLISQGTANRFRAMYNIPIPTAEGVSTGASGATSGATNTSRTITDEDLNSLTRMRVNGYKNAGDYTEFFAGVRNLAEKAQSKADWQKIDEYLARLGYKLDEDGNAVVKK